MPTSPAPAPLTPRSPIRARLKTLWLDPLALEGAGHHPELVAGFLTRCLFSMFAEDVGLLPRQNGKGTFTTLLETLQQNPAQFVPLLTALWREMDTGGFSVVLRETLPRFNGNPPFIGAASLRAALGDGYVEALRNTWNDVPESADLVMFWWHHAAQLVAKGEVRRFGLITTNSLKQTFNRRVVEMALANSVIPALPAPNPAIPAPNPAIPAPNPAIPAPNPATPTPNPVIPTPNPVIPAKAGIQKGAGMGDAALDSRLRGNDGGGFYLAFAIPDHPWVDSADGAAVRIAMTVGTTGSGEGRLLSVTDERQGNGEGLDVTLQEQVGLLHADLRVGANVAAAMVLQASRNISNRGLEIGGAGFIVTLEEADRLEPDAPIKHYRNGRDLTEKPRGVKVIDLYGLSVEEVRSRYPATYQWVLERVKPERDQNRLGSVREKWWLHRRLREDLRATLVGLTRYIATVETAKHRTFQFLDADIAPDNKLVCISLSDAFALGVLSSHVHVAWALATGSRLGVGNDPVYVKTRCFETFPFPDATPDQATRIRDLAEQLDAHRKRQQAAHATLTLTGMYNVLEKLRSGEALNAKEKIIHEQGLVSVLKSLHDELDAAVLDAYGWRDLLPSPSGRGAGDEGSVNSETLLVRLVALNAERAAEEARGNIRWLRPDYQHPGEPRQSAISIDAAVPASKDAAAGDTPLEIAIPRRPWPAALPEQVAAVASVLAASPIPLSAADLAARFTGKGPWRKRLPQIIDTLEALGRVRRITEASGEMWTTAG